MNEDMQVKREITLEADAEALKRMRKEGHFESLTTNGFTYEVLGS
jgi:hypothetical protein